MRTQVVFDPLYRGNYFVPRGAVKLPSSLLRCVWPDLDVWVDAQFEREDSGYPSYSLTCL
jgi:hypothetical protein